MEVSLAANVHDESVPVELWSLEQLIPRIVQERGSFANITEEDLLKEIEEEEMKLNGIADSTEDQSTEANALNKSNANSNAAAAADDDDSDVEMENATATERTPEMSEKGEGEENTHETELLNYHENRKQMTEEIKTALNEAALALDFVSLLLSCQRPAAGTTSMSPLLKQRVAVGSLGADALWNTPEEESPQVGAGWKLEALANASDVLLQASKRLSKEVKHESSYWKLVFDLANAGETLFKITKGDLRGLGVKYGFGDAGASYRYKGIALCNRDEKGQVLFKFDNPISGKHLRVYLYDMLNGEKKLVGYSSVADIVGTDNKALNELKTARSQIFEEELFYEMAREASLLASQKVTIVDGKIVIHMMDEVIEVGYVDVDAEERKEQEQDVQLYPACLKADFISCILHLLLCHAHSVNLAKRNAVPAPLNTKLRPNQGPLFILRPLIAQLQHNKILRRLSRLMQLIVSDYDDATIEVTRSSSDVNAKKEGQLSSSLDALLAPPKSACICSLPSKKIKITVNVTSLLQVQLPLYEASAESISTSGSDILAGTSTHISKAGFYELNELEEWINWVINGS